VNIKNYYTLKMQAAQLPTTSKNFQILVLFSNA